jgi:hypothetical protein
MCILPCPTPLGRPFNVPSQIYLLRFTSSLASFQRVTCLAVIPTQERPLYSTYHQLQCLPTDPQHVPRMGLQEGVVSFCILHSLLFFSASFARISCPLASLLLLIRPHSSGPPQQPSSSKHSSYHNTSSTSSTSAEQRSHLASRIAAFVHDPFDSQVQHRHSSADASIQEHTGRMKVNLDDFDVRMART